MFAILFEGHAVKSALTNLMLLVDHEVSSQLFAELLELSILRLQSVVDLTPSHLTLLVVDRRSEDGACLVAVQLQSR